MEQPRRKKIAYLFGAGATHAELVLLDPVVSEKPEERGLLMGNVSSRIIERARRIPRYLSNVEMVSQTKGSPNIELLISLIENSKIHGWEYKTRILKKLVQDDIESLLTKRRTDRFYLHRALLELHRWALPEEHLIGLVSLNYD